MTFLACLVLSLATAQSAPGFDAPVPALTFEPPPRFRAVTAQPPAIYEAVNLDKTQEQARLVLFVVPVPPHSPMELALSTATSVAGAYTKSLEDSPEVAVESEELSIVQGYRGIWAARLAVVPEQERHMGLLLFGRTETVDRIAGEFEQAGRSVSASAIEYPVELADRLIDQRYGFAIRPPQGFERSSTPVAPGLVEAHVPYHYGIAAALTVSLETEWLDRPLLDAAEAWRDRAVAAGEGATTVSFEQRQLGDRLSVRVEIARAVPPVRSVTHLLELGRVRLVITAQAPESRFERFRKPFEQSAASLQAIDRKITIDLEPRFTDSEAGFSLRPPIGFDRTTGGDALVAFQQSETLPPVDLLTIRGIDLVEPPTDMESCWSLASDRITAARDQGQVVFVAPSTRLMNGLVVARFGTAAGESPEDLCALQWLAVTDRGVFEITFQTTREEWPPQSRLVEASVRSFRSVRKTIAPALDERVGDQSGLLTFRPPLDWQRADADSSMLTFVEPGAAKNPGRVELGVSPLPAPAEFGGPAEAYRRAVVSELEERGRTRVRVEEASSRLVEGRRQYTFRIAYNLESGPMRELRRALQLDDRIVFVRAMTAGGRFNDHLLLFEATVSSLEAQQD